MHTMTDQFFVVAQGMNAMAHVGILPLSCGSQQNGMWSQSDEATKRATINDGVRRMERYDSTMISNTMI